MSGFLGTGGFQEILYFWVRYIRGVITFPADTVRLDTHGFIGVIPINFYAKQSTSNHRQAYLFEKYAHPMFHRMRCTGHH